MRATKTCNWVAGMARPHKSMAHRAQQVARALPADGSVGAWPTLSPPPAVSLTRLCTQVARSRHNHTMHGEYKMPGGKLVVADLEVRDDKLTRVRISGDFFL